MPAAEMHQSLSALSPTFGEVSNARVISLLTEASEMSCVAPANLSTNPVLAEDISQMKQDASH